MLFNSNIFIYLFLPCLLFFYIIIPVILKSRSEGTIQYQNIILLIFSLLFYYCTSGLYVFVLLFVVFVNYCAALLLTAKEKRKLIFVFSIIINIAVLVVFKYFYFVIDNINFVLDRLIKRKIAINFAILLPVGISFYLFQSLSYLIDVYQKKIVCQRNFFKLLLYVSLFPQLVAGPIVRYSSISHEIDKRNIKIDNIYNGVCRFIIGLAKKVLFADLFGEAVDKIFNLDFPQMTTPLAWTALLLYTLQIYFDFSAYSDMAIGLGKMLGFTFPENFNMPYKSQNITEFWRRWHLSLSSFLKDYLYIPLGGNKKGKIRTYLNLIIVFLLCGLWHGAAWTFIIWGIYQGFFLILERYLKNKYNFSMKGLVGYIVSFFIIMLGWLIFRSPSISYAFSFLKVLLAQSQLASYHFYKYSFYVSYKIIFFALLGLYISFVDLKKLKIINNNNIRNITLIIIFVITLSFIADSSFTPFIYFQF